MNNNVKEFAFCFAMGAMVAALPAVLAAGAYMTLVGGGQVTDVELETAWRYSPWGGGSGGPLFETGVLVGLAVFGLGGVGLAVLLFKPKHTSHGSARWATPAELKRQRMLVPFHKTIRDHGLMQMMLGKTGRPSASKAYLTSGAAPHALICAPSGAGKGVGVVIPTLLTWAGSVICLDIKGENFAKTARRRMQMGDEVYKFAPYDSEGRTHRFNPLDLVAQAPRKVRYSEAMRVASTLIVSKGKGAEGWISGCREIFSALCITAIEKGSPTIGTVFDLISEPLPFPDLFAKLSSETKDSGASKVLNTYAGYDPKVISGYISILKDSGLGLWADELVRDATAVSDFRLEDMRRKPMALYITIASGDLIPLEPLVRLLFEQLTNIMSQSEPGPDEGYKVLLLLDEFASLRGMEVLAKTITTLRSHGVQVMIIVQTIGSFDAYQADSKQQFFGNFDVQVFMAANDEKTRRYVSDSIGEFTRKSRSKSWQMNKVGQTNISERLEGARLVRADEAHKLGDQALLVLIRNSDPAKATRITYYEDRQLKKIFGAQDRIALPIPDSIWSAEDLPPAVHDAAKPLDRPQNPPESSEDPVEAEFPTLSHGDSPGASSTAPAPSAAATAPPAETAIRGIVMRGDSLTEQIHRARAAFAGDDMPGERSTKNSRPREMPRIPGDYPGDPSRPKKIPETTPLCYISDKKALNLRLPDEETGDWHFTTAFFENPTNPPPPIRVVGEGSDRDTTPALGSKGVRDMAAILVKQGVLAAVTGPVYVANHYRAIADIVAVDIWKRIEPGRATVSSINAWLHTEYDIDILREEYLRPMAELFEGEARIRFERFLETVRFDA